MEENPSMLLSDIVLEITGTADFKAGARLYAASTIIFLKVNTARTALHHPGPNALISDNANTCSVHKALTESTGIFIVAYDQIGNGYSTDLRDASKEFWTPGFMDELDNLLSYLGILIGQSWGDLLAVTPKGLCRLVFLNSPAPMELNEVGTTVFLGMPLVRYRGSQKQKGKAQNEQKIIER
ncbi:hypothetical protein EDD85DRAFT_790665 [Armillaria nabsnona]|nr:hypothetical protein EDD85DRAFT_790665 [Armillaria nabsnona]